MTSTAAATEATQIRRIDHREAMAITETENRRLLDQLTGLSADEWSRPTDCTRWDVRDVVVHLIGSAEAQANPIEFARQVAKGRKLMTEINGTHWVDGLNEAQLRGRAELPSADLPARWAKVSAAALKARRRMPAPVRALPVLPLGEALGTKLGWQPISYLFDIGFTRDVWMHRIDIARALGRMPELTADHDGRLIADIVAEWTGLHHEPFTLVLGGPAGGTYSARGGSEPVEVDAVEFCRILSGRAPGEGVLRHALPL
jgi:uncharacterized protein (TIGR03083 family)